MEQSLRDAGRDVPGGIGRTERATLDHRDVTPSRGRLTRVQRSGYA